MMTEKERIDFTRNLLRRFPGIRYGKTEFKEGEALRLYTLGSGDPSYLHTPCGVDSIFEMEVDGKVEQICDAQGISFTGYVADSASDNPAIDTELQDVMLNIIRVTTSAKMHIDPKATFRLILGATSKDEKMPKRIIEFQSFDRMLVGMGISVDDITTDNSVILMGGKATISYAFNTVSPEGGE